MSATAPLAHWIVRLEDVDIDGQVRLVTTGALNGAQQQTPPSPLQPNLPFTITLRLRFTTWTFLIDHRVRIAISNSMFPTYWPTPFAMNTSLFLDPSTTFIGLPVILPLSSIPSPPSFTQQQVQPADILPELFSSSKPRIYQNQETDLFTRVTFERTTYELLPNHIFTSTRLTWNFTCSHLNPADVQWTAQAQQIYVYDMDGYVSIDRIPIEDDDKGLYPDVDLSRRKHFQLNTDLTLYSDQDSFHLDFKRRFSSSNGTADEPPITFAFKNQHKRKFQ